ncbi:MAG: hypothetical protein J1F42_09190 [Lachnospiraceae bacterium]|nr:hypothetical protein [Lachnospiraceae bacterium]
MKIYKNVPEQFHSQFMDTINTIEEKQEKKYHRYGTKRMILLVAVLVLVLSTITVSAAYIFKWNQAALNWLGVSEELAEQLNQEGIAKQEHVAVSAAGVEISAIQSVMTDDYCYVLLSVSAPDQVPLDEVLFRETYVESDVGIESCVVNHALYDTEDNGHLWEALLYIDDAVDYSGADVVIVLQDLERGDWRAEGDETLVIYETLVEGEWRIPLTLPSESEILEINQERTMQIGHHEVNIKKTEVTPFQIRLYGDEEELKHAIHYVIQWVSGIVYQDGTFIEEDTGITVRNGRSNQDTGEYYIALDWPTAIDIRQYADMVLKESEDMSVPRTWSEDELNQMDILQDRCGHKILFDGTKIILWDEKCEVGIDIVDLVELGYDVNSGDLILLGPGGLAETGYDENDGNIVEVGPGGRLIQAFINGEKHYYDVMY